jgi:UDP-glucose 4-epimerase
VAKHEPIEIWGDGEVVRDYIYIEDLVGGIYKSSIMDTPSRIFNIGSGTGYSLNEIVEVIKSVTGCDVRVNYMAKRSFDVPKIYLDITRANRELQWSPVTPLETGLRKTWEFISSLR